MSHIKIFGCLAYGLKPKHDRTSKLDDIADIGYHVGVARYQRGWVLFIPNKKDTEQGEYKVYQTVHFNEDVLYRDQLSEPVPHTLDGVMFGNRSTEADEETPEDPPTPPNDTADTTQAMDGSEGSGEDEGPSDDSDGGGIPPPSHATHKNP